MARLARRHRSSSRTLESEVEIERDDGTILTGSLVVTVSGYYAPATRLDPEQEPDVDMVEFFVDGEDMESQLSRTERAELEVKVDRLLSDDYDDQRAGGDRFDDRTYED